MPWCSPDPRATFPLEGEPHWSRSLRRTLRLHPFRISVDEDFLGVIRACGETRAEGTWIIPDLVAGYHRLHELGWAHSVEVWERAPSEREGAESPERPERPENAEASAAPASASRGKEVLVGGIYGLAIGGLFAGESMFHTRTDASKIAFASLVARLRLGGFTLFDVQVLNDHLVSLGCVEMPRAAYLRRLPDALARPARLA